MVIDQKLLKISFGDLKYHVTKKKMCIFCVQYFTCSTFKSSRDTSLYQARATVLFLIGHQKLNNIYEIVNLFV